MDRSLLLRALREPASMGGLAPAEWDVLLRQGWYMGTLGRLCVLAAAAGVLPPVPSRVRVRLEAALEDVEQQHRLIRWEVIRLRRALAGTGVPLVLLKGAAYLHAGLPASRGRQFSDVDILVPRARLHDRCGGGCTSGLSTGSGSTAWSVGSCFSAYCFWIGATSWAARAASASGTSMRACRKLCAAPKIALV